MSWIKNILGMKPTKDEFAELARKSLASVETENVIVYDSDRFALQVKGPDGTTLRQFNLQNLYEEYCAAPRSEKSKVLSTYTQPVPEVPDLLADAVDNLLPRVQRRSFYVDMPFLADLGDMPSLAEDERDKVVLPHKAFAEHYAKGLVYDTPHTVLQISLHQCREWNSDFDVLMGLALKNLEKLTPKPFEQISPGFYASMSGDTHDASRILLLDRVKECNLIGRPVAMVPNRNIMMITGESDPDGLRAMLKVAKEALDDPRPMLAIPLVLIDDEWREMHVRADHPERKEFKYLRAISMADVYASHKHLLDRLHEQQNIDTFVASYMVIENQKTAEIETTASWSEGVRTLLPKVDLLAFVQGQEGEFSEITMVPWDAAAKVVGALMERQDTYPERYLVDAFPDAAQFAELKQLSVT